MYITKPNPPFEVSSRVTSDAANAYGAPVNATGTVVNVINDPKSTGGLVWIVRVRFQYGDTVTSSGGAFDFDYLASDLVAAT